jgi:hypothetical protein
MRGEPHKRSIDQITAADSIVTLLNRLDVKELPPNERMAVAETKLRYSKVRLAAWKSKLLGRGESAPIERTARTTRVSGRMAAVFYRIRRWVVGT